MFLKEIDVVSMNVCVQEKDKFIAETRASADLSVVLPYINAIFPRANYNPNSNSIKFKYSQADFSIIGNQINLQKFKSRTELMELLDWVQELINDIHDSMGELTPLHTTRKFPSVLALYSMLPKLNCQKCKEKTCMAFADRLYKMERELTDCPVLFEKEYAGNLAKLEKAFG
jgi:ArsR family metal-binding transcriptional regulator